MFVSLFLWLAIPSGVYASDEVRHFLDKTYVDGQLPEQLIRIIGACNVPDEMQAGLSFSRCRTPQQRKVMAGLIQEYFEMALDDEISGRVSALEAAYLNLPRVHPARDARALLLAEIDQVAQPDSPLWPMVLPSLTWLLSEERSHDLKIKALRLVAKIPGELADDIVQRQLSFPDPSVSVLVTAIQLAADRGLKNSALALRGLLSHPRQKVRAASQEALRILGFNLTADRVDAMPEYWKEEFKKFFRLGLFVPEESSRRIMVAVPGEERLPDFFWEKEVKEEKTVALAKDGQFWELVASAEGVKATSPQGDTLFYPGATIELSTLIKEAQYLTQAIQQHQTNFLEETNGLQEGWAYPMFVACWVLRAGEEVVAMDLVQVVLDAAFDVDDQAFALAREELAWRKYRDAIWNYTQGNLVPAQLLFDFIVKRIPGYRHASDCEKLSQQLLKDSVHPPAQLMTVAQWKKEVENLSASGQAKKAAMLLASLRSPMGWHRAEVPQDDSQLMNPAAILYHIGFEAVPALIPQLRNGKFVPLVKITDRNQKHPKLLRVCEVAADILADLTLLQMPTECLADASLVQQELEENRVRDWFEQNRLYPEAERLQRLAKASLTWSDVRNKVARLIELKVADAVPILWKMMSLPSTTDFDRAEILKACLQIDGAQIWQEAVGYLHDADPSIQIYAGIVTVLYGHRHKGIEAIGNALRRGTQANLKMGPVLDAVQVLLSTEHKEDFDLAATVFVKDYTSHAWGEDLNALVTKFWEHDPDGTLRILLENLRDVRDAAVMSPEGAAQRECDLWAKYLADFRMQKSGIRFYPSDSVEQRDEQIRKIRMHLNDELQKMAEPG